MSGDVQPRKRKDKKRRKDEAEQILTQPIPTHPPISTTPSSDDVNIHVHKEGGTGGGICAKLVFFVLLSALVVVIGMIITQYRGLSDVDTADTESKFAQIFEGWIDTGHRHDDHEVEEPVEDLDHDEEEIENASEDEEHEPSEEENDDDEDKELSQEDEDDEAEDEDEDEEEEPGQSDEDQPVEESEENSLEEEDNEEVSEERVIYGRDQSDEKDEEEDDEDEVEHDEDEQELQNIASDEDNDDSADEEAASTERVSKEDEDDDSDEDKVKEDVNESSEETSTKSGKVAEKQREAVEEIQSGEQQQGSSSMAIKLGVGVALLVVAHLVLVRKWRSAPVEKPADDQILVKEPTPDLSRRNTIVAPPTLQEVEPDIEQDEEDYSDEEELSDEESHAEPKSAKTRYQELRSSYTRSLTPEGEIDYHKEPEVNDEEYEEEEDEEISEEEEEEEGDSDIDEYDDDEDEELLKRLEAKYGKIQGEKREGASAKDADDSDSDRQSEDGDDYARANITNKEDNKIREKIDEAHKSVQNNSAYAIKLFDKILQTHPLSPRGTYGKALSLDYLADQRRSNEILQEALQYYTQLFDLPDVPDVLFQAAADRCINRMRFVGQYNSAIKIHWKLIKKFPDDPKHLNNLAVTYLTVNRIEEARAILKEVLSKWSDDGFALVHYGFILKTTDNNLETAVVYLRKGLRSNAEGVNDGRFYFHLGDALARLGKNDEAMQVYKEGVKNKVFLSKYQRSLYNVPKLTGKPWWEIDDLPYLDLFRSLQSNWQKIRDEGLVILNEKGYFQDESENLKDTGNWKQFELFARGQKNINNCKKCPFTCSIIEKIPEARGCKRGQTKFSVMHPGTHVWPHCGPTNCRLRVHLGLKVPPKTFIRVADEVRSWKEGEVFVFDDSFEHEVWHNGTTFRLVLIVDVWHPELTAGEKRSLSPI